MKLQAFLEKYKNEIDKELKNLILEKKEAPFTLKEALEYVLLNGGKRIRPLLALLVCHVLGGKASKAIRLSLSIELLHTSSLILDDLPSMDNSSFRRGKPACHIKFGEDNAILLAFALLNEAYYLLLKEALKFPQDKYPVEKYLELFFEKVGFSGLITGQYLDLHSGKNIGFEDLEKIHSLKTGSLFILSVKLGAMAAQAKKREIECLEAYAKNLGLAFQIQDDLLDFFGEEKTMGKPKGKDIKKTTFLNAIGIEESKKAINALIQASIDSLKPLKEKAELLKEFSIYVRERKK